MNKKILILLIADVVMIAAFGFIIYQNDLELERLKSISENYAKENESLKIDLELMRKKLIASESRNSGSQSDFAQQQRQKFQAMKEEIQRLKASSNAKNREKEDQIWDYTLEGMKMFVDVELTKRLDSFGFKPEETEVCVNEYKNALEKSKDTLLQWYRDEITDADYINKILDISRDFYKETSASIGENLASIALSVVIPDPNFRRIMFEEK